MKIYTKKCIFLNDRVKYRNWKTNSGELNGNFEFFFCFSERRKYREF